MSSAPAPRQLDAETLESLVQCSHVESLSVRDLLDLFRDEEASHEYLPEGVQQIDPRDGAVITYNASRSRRPHSEPVRLSEVPDGPCPICDGHTTGIVDIAPLSEGATFINKNLYPILRGRERTEPGPLMDAVREDLHPLGQVAHGLHFLQWTSSVHIRDWHNMPHGDRVIVLERLAALERKLLYESEGLMPVSEPWRPGHQTYGFVSIIKNFGRAVGGSLSHGHQQVAFSNIMPRRFYNNLHFFEERRETFSGYMQRVNPASLRVRDYGQAILVVPYFMRRPYDMMLLVKDVGKQYLSDLDEGELSAVASGWHDASRAILAILPRLGRHPAFNVTVNNGPGAGLYLEFLPFTQETGGFEHLGLWVCQDSPHNVAPVLARFLESESGEALAGSEGGSQ